jgi:hypothetical protein
MINNNYISQPRATASKYNLAIVGSNYWIKRTAAYVQPAMEAVRSTVTRN